MQVAMPVNFIRLVLQCIQIIVFLNFCMYVLFMTVFLQFVDFPNDESFSKKDGNPRTLHEPSRVAAYQDQAQLSLSHHIQAVYPSQPFRFGKLLLLLPGLRTANQVVVEELFFRRIVGDIPIEKLLVDMLGTAVSTASPASSAASPNVLSQPTFA